VDPNPLLDDERLTAAGLLFEASSALMATLERRLGQECGLSVPWFEVLVRLARSSPEQRLRMCDLAAQVAMSPSGLTRVVDRLVDAGLVTREQCPTDRRVAWAQLTPAGRARIEEAVPVHLRHLDELLVAPLSEDQRASLHAVLRILRDHVNPTAAQVSA
jgi:DNA-binding MarR family transcriptional regulator